MSNKTRSIIKAIAVVMVLLCVAMKLDWVSIPALSVHIFWILIIAFGMVLIASR